MDCGSVVGDNHDRVYNFDCTYKTGEQSFNILKDKKLDVLSQSRYAQKFWNDS